MPRLLHRSEKFEIHEVENQTFRHGLACADCVAKSNSLVGRHFDRPSAACRPLGTPESASRNVVIEWPAWVDGYLGEPDRKPGAGQAQSPKRAMVAGKFADREIVYCWE